MRAGRILLLLISSFAAFASLGVSSCRQGNECVQARRYVEEILFMCEADQVVTERHTAELGDIDACSDFQRNLADCELACLGLASCDAVAQRSSASAQDIARHEACIARGHVSSFVPECYAPEVRLVNAAGQLGAAAAGAMSATPVDVTL